jgi:hypothetical protein
MILWHFWPRPEKEEEVAFFFASLCFLFFSSEAMAILTAS